MSSGGPRAAGSNLKNEGQFRQRVVSYYKIMADSRKSLNFHCKLQLASAVGLASTTGAAVVASNAGMLVLILTGFAALSLGVASRLDHARSDKAQTAAYQLRCKLGLSSVVGMAGGVAMELLRTKGTRWRSRDRRRYRHRHRYRYCWRAGAGAGAEVGRLSFFYIR